jgi:hypothetical protein
LNNIDTGLNAKLALLTSRYKKRNLSMANLNCEGLMDEKLNNITKKALNTEYHNKFKK